MKASVTFQTSSSNLNPRFNAFKNVQPHGLAYTMPTKLNLPLGRRH